MQVHKIQLSLALYIAFASPFVLIGSPRTHESNHRHQELKEAMGVAEAETGGEAVTVRRISMNGTASPDGLGGIEVLVHMKHGKHGWRCLIDGNNMKLRSKETISNPPSKVR